MNDLNISVSETRTDDDIAVLGVEGIINTLTVGELERLLDGLIGGGRMRIIIDMASAEYISTPGWSLFVDRRESVQRQGGDIKLVRMIPNVAESFRDLELDHVLAAYDTVDQAREAFGAVITAGQS